MKQLIGNEMERVISERENKIPEGFRPRGDSTQSERKAATLERDKLKQELIGLTLKYFDSEQIRNRLEKAGLLEFQVGRFIALGYYWWFEEHPRFQVNYFKEQKLIASVTWGDPYYALKATFWVKNGAQEVKELIHVLRTKEPVILR